MDGKIPQVKKCFFCSKNSIDPSNPKNAIKERYNKLLKDQLMTLKTHIDANHLLANFFEKEINSLSKRKCGNVIYF